MYWPSSEILIPSDGHLPQQMELMTAQRATSMVTIK